jgi:hypothetical protein
MMKAATQLVIAICLAPALGVDVRAAEVTVSRPPEAVDRDQVFRRVVAGAPKVLAPLQKLEPDQKRSVAALIVLTRAADAYSRAAVKPNRKALAEWNTAVGSTLPEMRQLRGVGVELLRGCFGESVSYLSALKDCENDDPPRNEDKCPEAREPAAAEIACFMKAFEDLIGKLEPIVGGFPPEPQPLPIRD